MAKPQYGRAQQAAAVAGVDPKTHDSQLQGGTPYGLTSVAGKEYNMPTTRDDRLSCGLLFGRPENVRRAKVQRDGAWTEVPAKWATSWTILIKLFAFLTVFMHLQ